ncbi:MAG TPA: prolyl oligopeptidase family serine peptidase [Acidimicrobiales bacterium]|nr:prolyl oligopeptidase family serine peptidase [Acidimicrobiales bacterium]
MAKTAPYGTWESPIGAAQLVEDRLRFLDCVVDGDDVYWAEGRPSEGGRVAVARANRDGSVADLLPGGYSARTTVHEYGGQPLAVKGGIVYFANFSDQRLYRLAEGGEPEPITADPLERWAVRYAGLTVSADGRFVYCVRERHGAEVVNDLVALATDGEAEARVVAEGHDFFGAPALSADGRKIAWVSWDHPQMPWDGTELWEAELGKDGLPVNPKVVAGSTSESITQPRYSPAGVLHFVSDRTGWWNLYADTGDAYKPRHLWPAEADFAEPDWVFGTSSYAFGEGGSIIVSWIEGGFFKLGRLAPGQSGTYELAIIDSPYTSIGNLRAVGDGIVAIAGSPTMAASVVRLSMPDGTPTILRAGAGAAIDESYLSAPESLEFVSEDGLTAHALLYRPRNADFEGPVGEAPPLVVVIHGGPTSMAQPLLNYAWQYWTSRGFALVDVNYGGSSGYGRDYRARLQGKWGVVDLDDCCNAAKHLRDAGVVDGLRMVIRGGSAGGYTTLCAAVFRDVFAAGASYYGVADLSALARHTHKFEARYMDGLVAPWPAGAAVYESRSPRFHADKLHTPLIVFQGLEDAVVPPEQAEIMISALRENGIPFAYMGFEGEQHGFRQAGTIKRSSEAELYFYGRVLGFTPADDIEPVEIENEAALLEGRS